jgi:hypothetical protein
MTKRKFYRTVVQVEVLSEEPLIDPENLDTLMYEITDGGCSGSTKIVAQETIHGKYAADLLNNQGSDPGFFGLDAEGNDTPEFALLEKRIEVQKAQ